MITTDKYVYIIEFKCNQSPDVAIKQIKEKGYADRFIIYKNRDKNIEISKNKDETGNKEKCNKKGLKYFFWHLKKSRSC